MPIPPVLGMMAKEAATSAAGTAGAGATGGIMGMIFGRANDRRQLRQQERLQRMQMQGQKEMTDYNAAKQLEMWEKTGYGAQMRQMKEAGINPALMYGMGGGGGQTAAVSQGNVSGGQAPSGGNEMVAMTGMAMQMGLMKAQQEVLKSQANLNNVEAEKKAGVDTANVKADTENKILQKIVTEYTGKEAKDVYEKISNPNRNVAMEADFAEKSARMGIAQTINELWTEGKLKEKSVAEIEQLLLANAKTREETRKIYKEMEMLEQNIKGQKLENIMKDLESRLQTETGIDRNSPAWMKILGRLFIQLTTQ